VVVVDAAQNPALLALDAAGIAHAVTRHGPVTSLAEAAAARGVQPGDIIKTLVVRRADDDFLFVLVPGDREISWPKLRALLGVNRISMPDAATAREVTGYERGTITPFGSTRAWPVVADETVADVVRALDARLADVTDPLG
jgi:Cys-tRNA(Pro) deacylase